MPGKKKNNNHLIMIAFLCTSLLAGCQGAGGGLQGEVAVGSLWEVPTADSGEVSWDLASMVAQEQRSGYSLAGERLGSTLFIDIVSGEGNQEDDVQIAIRKMVEDPETPIAALLGATSNEATMRAASLVNFFNVPMIIPTANGDNLLPSNNLWAFRLSAPGSAYAEYLLGTLLTKEEFGSDPDPETTADSPRLHVAILYEGNSFGESAAVATARAAMELGVGIGVYASYPATTPNPTRLNAIIDSVESEDVELVTLISSNPGVAKTLVQLFHSRILAESLPVLVGQAGGFASQDFIESPEAEGIYILRQKVNPENCPADIHSIYGAQTYAAIKLLDLAVQGVYEAQPAEKWYAAISNPLDKTTDEKTDRTAAFREAIRDALKQTDTMLPCVGKVAFDNTGQVKNPVFELITIANGEIIISPVEDFINAVKVQNLLGSQNE